MAPKRPRFCGDNGAIVAALTEAASLPDFLKYSESLTGPVRSERILEHKAMWRSIYSVAPNLCFSQGQVEDMMVKVAEAKARHWPRSLTEAELKEWKASLAKQLRAQARAITKCKRSTWVTDLLGGRAEGVQGKLGEQQEDDEEEDASDDGENNEDDTAVDESKAEPTVAKRPAVEESKAEPTDAKRRCTTSSAGFLYGYDREVGKAWRSTGNGPRELAIEMKFSDAANEDGNPIAVFSDGSEKEIVQVTVKEVNADRTMRQGARRKLWSTNTEKSHVFVSFRKDRSPLLILFEEEGDAKAKQLVQLHVKNFGDDPMEQVMPNNKNTFAT